MSTPKEECIVEHVTSVAEDVLALFKKRNLNMAEGIAVLSALFTSVVHMRGLGYVADVMQAYSKIAKEHEGRSCTGSKPAKRKRLTKAEKDEAAAAIQAQLKAIIK